MGCKKCKEKKVLTNVNQEEIDNASVGEKVLIVVVKFLLFCIVAPILTVIIIPFSLYMLFNVLFLEGNVDITSGLVSVGKMLTGKSEEEDDEDEEEDDINDEEYNESGIEDITEEFKK
jgi:hypothetical protein